ncbi:hypothetical protein SNOG_03006 [Parastagonospora nodorum SN15]|uniref:Uncharacterized protein n=1 Tax=Phaeosphaeria nodorum (strain SN15 / ATCC MYA-4574 / FGSC 10173) TaxID=321614 RepID=Q0UZ08_PHANO|nr:hypothetical protein SNOG_03006 [Parastagonospora nodorum SN15]EAT89737.1 hypothetical protein SNOG_03006 [Parastagonospora nodorum SN15]
MQLDFVAKHYGEFSPQIRQTSARLDKFFAAPRLVLQSASVIFRSYTSPKFLQMYFLEPSTWLLSHGSWKTDGHCQAPTADETHSRQQLPTAATSGEELRTPSFVDVLHDGSFK